MIGPNQEYAYHIRSFFSALHAILTSILSPDNGLQEYVHIFILVTSLLGRLLRHYKSRCSDIQIPRKVSLLVVLPSPYQHNRQLRSRAAIGFSATGSAKTKKSLRNKLIHDRIQNLPELTRLAKRKGYPSPGNCAEAETLSHLVPFVSNVRGIAQNHRQLVLSVTTTLHLLNGTPDQNCPQCIELLGLLRGTVPLLRTFDLAPT